MASVCQEHASAGQRHLSDIFLVKDNYLKIFFSIPSNIFFYFCSIFVDRKGWRGTNCDQVDDDEKQVKRQNQRHHPRYHNHHHHNHYRYHNNFHHPVHHLVGITLTIIAIMTIMVIIAIIIMTIMVPTVTNDDFSPLHTQLPS